jgi:ankyrin repeat protein
METIDVLLEAGADVSVRDVEDALKAFTTSEFACRLSCFIKPLEHGRFFKEALETIAIHSEDDDSATRIVKNVMASCVVSAPCQCLAADSLSTDAVAPAARRGYVKFVKLLNALVKPSWEDNHYQERVLAVAISSGNKELIYYLLSLGPDLDPPAFYADTINRPVLTTSLAEALRSGDKDLVKIFEEAGAFRQLSEGNRFRPVLQVAIETGRRIS